MVDLSRSTPTKILRKNIYISVYVPSGMLIIFWFVSL